MICSVSVLMTLIEGSNFVKLIKPESNSGKSFGFFGLIEILTIGGFIFK